MGDGQAVASDPRRSNKNRGGVAGHRPRPGGEGGPSVDGCVVLHPALDDRALLLVLARVQSAADNLAHDLGVGGSVVVEHGPFGAIPPPRQQIDRSVAIRVRKSDAAF